MVQLLNTQLLNRQSLNLPTQSNALGVIFDCDGTLVDSERIYVRTYAKILQNVGLELTDSQIQEKFCGMKLETSREIISQEFNKNIQDFRKQFRQISQEIKRTQKVKSTEGTQSFFESTQVPFAIASNAPMAVIQENIDIFNKTQEELIKPEQVFSAHTSGFFKPHPQVFLEAAEYLNIAPSNLIVVEDSLPGIQAAISGGFTPVLFLNGNNSHIQDRYPDIKSIDNMTDLNLLLS